MTKVPPMIDSIETNVFAVEPFLVLHQFDNESGMHRLIAIHHAHIDKSDWIDSVKDASLTVDFLNVIEEPCQETFVGTWCHPECGPLLATESNQQVHQPMQVHI